MAIFIKVETAVTRPTKICLFVTKSLKSEVSVCVFHGHFPIFRELDVQDVSVEYPRSLSGAKYIFVRKSGFFGYELKLLISTAGGRFPRAWLEPPRSFHSLWGLKAHGTALSFVPPKTFCYSRRTRRAQEALHRTKKFGLYFRGVAAFRSNQRCSASDYE